LLAALAPAQTLQRLFIAGVRQQLEAAQTFESDDGSLTDRLSALGQRGVAVCQDFPGAIPQFQTRPAQPTGDRLGVKTPIARIGIFAAAVCAQAETPHRCVRPVIRQTFDDAEARAALRAI